MSFPQIQNTLPDFVPNQVLTNVQLNQLRDYLDHQTRLSRLRLVGTGIVCGLYARQEGSQASKQILIGHGYGLTSAGYLLEVPCEGPDEVTYNRYRTYVDPLLDENEVPQYEPWVKNNKQIDLWELIPEGAKAGDDFEIIVGNEPKKLTASFMKDKVLVLYMELEQSPLKSCLTTDCNNKGQNLDFYLRPLLVNKDDLQKIAACSPADFMVPVPRLYAALMRTTGKPLRALANAQELNDAYRDLITYAKDRLVPRVENAFQSYRLLLGLDELGESVGKLSTHLQKVASDPSLNQYSYDFILDLVTAYQEFAQLMCELVPDCCPPSGFDRHLMIRAFSGTNLYDEPGYRHEFQASPVRNVAQGDLQKVRKRFFRILKLAEAFEPAPKQNETITISPDDFKGKHKPQELDIKITPSRTAMAPLGVRALPYYYRAKRVQAFWQPTSCCTPPLISYEKNEQVRMDKGDDYPDYPVHPLGFNPSQSDFYRIEGHLGETANKAYNTLQMIRERHNLDFELVNLRLEEPPEGLPIYPEIESIRQMLGQIREKRQALEHRVAQALGQPDGVDWIGILTDLLAGIGEINNWKKQIEEEDLAWANARARQELLCDVSHLQADYLTTRNEIICTYDKLCALMEGLPEFDYLNNFQAVCVDFEADEVGAAGTTYTPSNKVGTRKLMFVEDEVDVSILRLGDSRLGGANSLARVEEQTGFGEGKVMRLESGVLAFSFSQLSFTPNLISIDFQENGKIGLIEVTNSQGTERLDSPIQGLDGKVLNNGINLSVNQGSLYLVGEVGDVVIGGDNLLIDNICAISMATNNEAFNTLNQAGFSMTGLNTQMKTVDSRLEATRKNMKSATGEDKKRFEAELKSLEHEKAVFTQYNTLMSLSQLNAQRTVLHSEKMGELKATRKEALVASAVTQIQVLNPMLYLALSLFYALYQLKDRVRDVKALLPKDLLRFNYYRFLDAYKAVQDLIIQLLLLLVVTLEVSLMGSGGKDDPTKGTTGLNLSSYSAAFRSIPRDAWIQLLAINILPVWDFLIDFNKVRRNCFHAEMATHYFGLEHLLLGARATWHNFVWRHPGAEHLAGVERGGTFILLSEEVEDEKKGTYDRVIADFALGGKPSCCCRINPERICLPPVALPDYTFVLAHMKEGTEQIVAEKTFKIISNDYELDPEGFSWRLKAHDGDPEPTALGATVSVASQEKGTVTYQLEGQRFGFDHFTYEIIDNRCGLVDTGTVWVMIQASTIKAPPPKSDRRLVSYSFTGRVVDAANNDPLPGVSMVVKGQAKGATTDMNGNFNYGFNEAGDYDLQFSYVGYQTETILVTVSENGQDNLGEVRMSSSFGKPGFTDVKKGFQKGEWEKAVNLTAENTKVKPEEAAEVMSKTLVERQKRNEEELKAKIEEGKLGKVSGAAQAEKFITETLAQPEPSAAELADAYQELTHELVKAYAKAASKREQKALRAVLETTTHAYLDKQVIKAGEELPEEVKKGLEASKKEMESAGISVRGIRNRWKGSDLRDDLKLKAAEEMMEELGR
jgi:hypothetical protein